MISGASNRSKAKAIYPNGITMAEAEELLISDVRSVATVITNLIHVNLTDNQMAALISFVFNVGLGAFKRSTLLLKINNGKLADVPIELMRWTKAGGKVLSGLVRRRKAEVSLWMRT